MNKKEKNRIQSLVREAVRKGTLDKPKLCEKCSLKKPLAGHHHKGYEFPLDILWVCQKCHSEIHYVQRGNLHFHKLNEKDVLDIRFLYKKNELTLAKLGEQYKVHPSTIQLIVKKKRWVHV